jgi:hypothetical protein
MKINYWLIGIILAISLVSFGSMVYYFGTQSSKKINQIKQDQGSQLLQLSSSDKEEKQLKEELPMQSSQSPIPSEKNGTTSWQKYENLQYGFIFKYPKSYTVLSHSDCSIVTKVKSACLVALSLDPNQNEYLPKASFWLLQGINSVNIVGQIREISFDLQKRVWIGNHLTEAKKVFPVWSHTKSGKEIIKSSNWGSHSSSYYYIIPDYKNDKVAIFEIPQSYRLRCDFIKDEIKQADCNRFYKLVIDQYNRGKMIPDTWLPENYLTSVYAEAENIIKSYREITE